MSEVRKASARRFPIAKEALEFFVPLLVLAAVCLLVNILLAKSLLVLWVVAGVLFALALFTLYFFRDPLRECDYSAGTILSPADGKVVAMADVVENEFLHGDARRVSIFLRIFDIHMNYAPIGGTLDYKKYHKGRFGIAGFDKASDLNEHVTIGVSNGEEKLSFKIIAGMIARRIVMPLEIGSTLRAGEKIGMVKFGSRADVFIPPEYEVTVKVGQKVKGALTVIARRK